MSTGRYAFKQTDLARALRAAEKARPGGYRVHIHPKGVIELLPLAPGEALADAPADDLDANLAAWRAKRR